MADAPGSIAVLQSTAGAMGVRADMAGTATEGTTEGNVFLALGRWQRYLEVSGRCNANTRRQYRRAVFAFLADLFSSEEWDRPCSLGAITEDDVVAYLADIDPKSGMRAQTLKGLRSLYAWACARDEALRNPVGRLVPRKPKMRKKPSLSPEQTAAVLDAAAELHDPRARWAIQLQLATGCRVGSLLEVLPEDIRDTPKGPTIYFSEAKGDKPYEIALGPRGREAVAQLVDLLDYRPVRVTHRRPTLIGVGYQAYRQWVAKVSIRSGVNLTTHLFRHTAITRWAEDPKVAPRTIMERANWADLSQFRTYADASEPSMRRLAERHG
jgi:integrase